MMLSEASLSIKDRTLFLCENIKEGSSVFVRVLEKIDTKTYLVSFSGKKVIVSSEILRKPGESFNAKITVKKDQIILVPQIEEKEISSIYKLDYYSQLGLPLNALSERIIQFVRQNNLVYKKNKFQNIYKIASLFGDKEKEAAEVAMLLDEKEIPLKADVIVKFLNLLSGKEDSNSDLLAEANKKNPSNEYWLTIPYSIPFNGIEKVEGSIRLLKNKSNNVKVIRVNACIDGKEFLFRIDLNNQNFRDTLKFIQVFYCIIPGIKESEKNKITSALRSSLDSMLSLTKSQKVDVSVQYFENLQTDGVYIQNTDVNVLRIEA